MNGAENYAAAERLLANIDNSEFAADEVAAEAAVALVHAVQANTAAILATSNRRVTDADDWAEAIRGA